MEFQRKILWFWIKWPFKVPLRVLDEPKQDEDGNWTYPVELVNNKWRIK